MDWGRWLYTASEPVCRGLFMWYTTVASTQPGSVSDAIHWQGLEPAPWMNQLVEMNEGRLFCSMPARGWRDLEMRFTAGGLADEAARASSEEAASSVRDRQRYR